MPANDVNGQNQPVVLKVGLMAKRMRSNAGNGIIALSFAALLAGCSGNTYGTGVSAEAQLAEDIGDMVSLGIGGKEKTVIDYNARPKLVKAPAESGLPTPSESTESESAYFPTNPEEARAARLNANRIDPSVRDDGPLGATRSGPASRGDLQASAAKIDRQNRDPSASEMLRESVDGKEERARRIAEINGTGLGAGPRRYLTEPPSEYRTPANTAPVGDVGEKEVKRRKKKSESWFDNPFKGIFGG